VGSVGDPEILLLGGGLSLMLDNCRFRLLTLMLCLISRDVNQFFTVLSSL